MAKATQIQPKLILSTCVNGSLYKKTPKTKLMLGERYCKKPSVANETLLAPWANKSKGIEVAKPENRTNKITIIGKDAYEPEPSLTLKNKNPKAIGATIKVSAAKPVRELNFESFLTNP